MQLIAVFRVRPEHRIYSGMTKRRKNTMFRTNSKRDYKWTLLHNLRYFIPYTRGYQKVLRSFDFIETVYELFDNPS